MQSFGWLLVLACLLAPAMGLAQEAEPQTAREQASGRFHRGVELFHDQAYVAALVEFERAYELLPDYRVLYNVGRTKFELQDFLGAAQAYERYLGEGGAAVPAERKDEVESSLRSLRTRVGRILISVNRHGVDVFLDDVKIGRAPLESSVPVNVGKHRVMARSPEGAVDSQTVSIPGGETVEVSLNIAAPRPQAVAAQPESNVLRTFAITGWSAGGALLLGALTTGIMTMSADRDFDGLMKQVNVDAGKEADQRHKLKTYALVTDVLIASGATLAAAGTVMWFVDRAKKKRDQEPPKKGLSFGLDVGVGSLGMHGRF